MPTVSAPRHESVVESSAVAGASTSHPDIAVRNGVGSKKRGHLGREIDLPCLAPKAVAPKRYDMQQCVNSTPPTIPKPGAADACCTAGPCSLPLYFYLPGLQSSSCPGTDEHCIGCERIIWNNEWNTFICQIAVEFLE